MSPTFGGSLQPSFKSAHRWCVYEQAEMPDVNCTIVLFFRSINSCHFWTMEIINAKKSDIGAYTPAKQLFICQNVSHRKFWCQLDSQCVLTRSTLQLETSKWAMKNQVGSCCLSYYYLAYFYWLLNHLLVGWILLLLIIYWLDGGLHKN